MADGDLDLTEYNGQSLVATAVIFLVVSWISVGLRTYTRAILMKSFQADDWFMLIAQLIFTVSCAFVLEGVHKGMGRHNEAVKDENDRSDALMWQAIATATYILDMMFIKLSIGIFLLRLSVRRAYTWIIWGSLVVITLWSIVIFFYNLFQCTPVEKQWDFRIKSGHCVTPDELIAAAYAFSVMTIVSDWFYALLPIPMLWTVKMTKQAKATVIVILGLGIFASVATLIRLKFLTDLEVTDDLLFAGTNSMIWTLVEPGVAIVASSLATIRPLLRALKVRGFESSDYAYGTGRSATNRSAATRSKPSNMPGYGPNDVSLVNVEPNFDAKPRVGPNNLGITVQEQNKSLPTIPLTPGLHSPVRSEIYVIEGHRNSPPRSPWHHRGYSSPSGSLEELHDLEAQSQDFDARPRR
ncbi:Fc.00g052640.m01.CDS01 [Cosmosporella sp. VM-42]